MFCASSRVGRLGGFAGSTVNSRLTRTVRGTDVVCSVCTRTSSNILGAGVGLRGLAILRTTAVGVRRALHKRFSDVEATFRGVKCAGIGIRCAGAAISNGTLSNTGVATRVGNVGFCDLTVYCGTGGCLIGVSLNSLNRSGASRVLGCFCFVG